MGQPENVTGRETFGETIVYMNILLKRHRETLRFASTRKFTFPHIRYSVPLIESRLSHGTTVQH